MDSFTDNVAASLNEWMAMRRMALGDPSATQELTIVEESYGADENRS